jgi:hypothetical protein
MAGSAPVQQTVADATNTVTSAAVESPDNVGRFGMSSMSGASSSQMRPLVNVGSQDMLDGLSSGDPDVRCV